MVALPMHKRLRLTTIAMCLGAFVFWNHKIVADLSSLAKNDPYPIYTAMDPHEFLYTWDTQALKGFPLEIERSQVMSLSISPFAQNACTGKNFCGDKVPMGDLTGRWNMIGLLMGPLPEGKVLPDVLLEALNGIFPGFDPGTLNDSAIIDPVEQFGFFSVPMKYKKLGVRFQFSAMLLCDFGFVFQGGVADITRKICNFDNLTCLDCPTSNCSSVVAGTTDVNTCCNRICDAKIPCCGYARPSSDTTAFLSGYPSYTRANVNTYLMDRFRDITDSIGLDVCNYHKVALEDLRFSLFWRHAHLVNKGKGNWAEFLFIPYLMIGGSVATGPEQDSNIAASLPFGNNGHNSVGFTGGMNFDFSETIEIGGEVGLTYFFPHTYCDLRMPNQVPSRKCQLGIFPFTTAAKVTPGINWEFAAKMQAYHFIDRLSFYFQYVLVHHEDDEICLQHPDQAFAPGVLEQMSSFTSQFGNVSFYYDISPNVALGVLAQLPFNQKNAFKSTTVMGSVWATF